MDVYGNAAAGNIGAIDQPCLLRCRARGPKRGLNAAHIIMVQLVDTSSWFSGLIQETEAGLSDTDVYQDSYVQLSDQPAGHHIINADLVRRIVSVRDV
tara:strand:+ start:68 stop:361 length:294 start_codon:yes stop_codon:yes gene_type:complete